MTDDSRHVTTASGSSRRKTSWSENVERSGDLPHNAEDDGGGGNDSGGGRVRQEQGGVGVVSSMLPPLLQRQPQRDKGSAGANVSVRSGGGGPTEALVPLVDEDKEGRGGLLRKNSSLMAEAVAAAVAAGDVEGIEGRRAAEEAGERAGVEAGGGEKGLTSAASGRSEEADGVKWDGLEASPKKQTPEDGQAGTSQHTPGGRVGGGSEAPRKHADRDEDYEDIPIGSVSALASGTPLISSAVVMLCPSFQFDGTPLPPPPTATARAAAFIVETYTADSSPALESKATFFDGREWSGNGELENETRTALVMKSQNSCGVYDAPTYTHMQIVINM